MMLPCDCFKWLLVFVSRPASGPRIILSSVRVLHSEKKHLPYVQVERSSGSRRGFITPSSNPVDKIIHTHACSHFAFRQLYWYPGGTANNSTTCVAEEGRWKSHRSVSKDVACYLSMARIATRTSWCLRIRTERLSHRIGSFTAALGMQMRNGMSHVRWWCTKRWPFHCTFMNMRPSHHMVTPCRASLIPDLTVAAW